MQLLDGGMLDNSALGTVTEMLPDLLANIREITTRAGPPPEMSL